MPFKDPKKRKKYRDKYNREHPISPEKRHQYYITYKKAQFARMNKINNMYENEIV